MKASRFSDAQKAFILKQGDDGTPVADICRKAKIGQTTYFRYADLLPDKMRRLKVLKPKNATLKRVSTNLVFGHSNRVPNF